MSRFCPRHQSWLLTDPDAPLQLWAQLVIADEAGAFNTPPAQIERWHAALELTEILLASGRAEALPCLLVAEAVIRELPWQWPGLAGLLQRLDRLIDASRRRRCPGVERDQQVDETGLTPAVLH